MCTEFGRVHVLQRSNPVGEVPCIVGSQLVLENISPFGHVVDEEVRGRIAGAFIIAQPALAFVARQYIQGFKAAGTHVLDVDELHLPVGLDF